MTTPAPGSPDDVVRYWQAAGPARWFRKDPAFDADFTARFLAAHDAAASGERADWAEEAPGALALLILLDQFPRNAFRNTPRMFATDGQALGLARDAIDRGLDVAVDRSLRAFFYLPFMHSERLDDQRRCVALCEPLGEQTLKSAREHLDVIERFGRFPHRNTVLGRATAPQEQEFLDGGGFAG